MKKLISKKLGNEKVLYASIAGQKEHFLYSCVKILVIVSKCWLITALFLVLSG